MSTRCAVGSTPRPVSIVAASSRVILDPSKNQRLGQYSRDGASFQSGFPLAPRSRGFSARPKCAPAAVWSMVRPGRVTHVPGAQLHPLGTAVYARRRSLPLGTGIPAFRPSCSTPDKRTSTAGFWQCKWLAASRTNGAIRSWSAGPPTRDDAPVRTGGRPAGWSSSTSTAPTRPTGRARSPCSTCIVPRATGAIVGNRPYYEFRPGRRSTNGTTVSAIGAGRPPPSRRGELHRAGPAWTLGTATASRCAAAGLT